MEATTQYFYTILMKGKAVGKSRKGYDKEKLTCFSFHCNIYKVSS